MVYTPKKHPFILYLSIFLICFVLITAVFLLININPGQLEVQKNEVINLEKQNMEAVNQYLQQEFTGYQKDLFFLKDIYLNNSIEQTEQIWKMLIDKNLVYHQARYIDRYGNEIIRINQDDGNVIIVETDELQNKNDRYYFQESKSIKDGDIYYSAFDLNIENGVIEEPRVPTIRISTPIYIDGQFFGIIILNCDLTILLDVIENQFYTNSCNLMIINRNGYYIQNKLEPEKEFAFMFINLSHNKFLNDYPEAWKEISDLESNQVEFIVTDNGVFSYQYIIKLNSSNIKAHDTNYILISFLDPTSEDGQIFYYTIWNLIINALKDDFAFGVFIFLFSGLLAYMLGQREMHKRQIAIQARTDSFTKTYNRMYGFLLFEKQNFEYQRKNKNAAICFVDIDSLKFVNDTYGHKNGDLLITKTVDTIKSHLSKNDLIIRLGGDEFLIVFEKLSVIEAEKLWQKISNDLNQIKLGNEIDFIVWLSHGISEYGVGCDDIMEAISLADKRMYQEKYDRKMKNMR